MAESKLDEILLYWAADREGVPVTGISELSYDFDNGWPGTEETVGVPPEVVISYKVTRSVIYRHEAASLGNFIADLALVARRGPLPSEIKKLPDLPPTDEAESDSSELDALEKANRTVQQYVDKHGAEIPNYLLHLLSNLDWAVTEITGRANA